MHTGDPDSQDVGESPRDLLLAAEGRVAHVLAGLYRSEPERAQEAERRLRALSQEIRAMLEEASAKRPEGLVRSPLDSVLVRSLTHELIQGAGPGPESAAATMVVLRACSTLSEAAERGQTFGDRSHDDLEARMRSPGAFELLIEIAHDFRSPLTSILFLADALRNGHSGPVTEAQRTQLGLVYSAAFGLSSVASDIMDLARKEQDLTSDAMEAFSVSEMFREVERMVRPLVEVKGLDLRLAVPDRLHGYGYRHALSRVLLNLATNALKFTDEGYVELGVRARPGRKTEYYVQDTGRGISPAQQEELFNPFRPRTGKARDGHHFSGTGIGLSIARRLLRAMGSDLSLDFSSPEDGTRFSFVLGPQTRT